MFPVNIFWPFSPRAVVRLVSGLNSDVEGTLGGLRRAFETASTENAVRTGLRLHPSSRALVLNSSPGLLQFFDTDTLSLSSEVRTWDVVFAVVVVGVLMRLCVVKDMVLRVCCCVVKEVLRGC